MNAVIKFFNGTSKSDISIRACNDEDLDILAFFNKQLIEDERSNNVMNPKQLKERMRDFMHTDFSPFIFEAGGKPIGYALVNIKTNPYYLRQFFISRDIRRQGYGKKAFYKLLEKLDVDTLDLEVLYWNERGLGFWRSLGCKERSIYMRYGGK